MILETPFLGKIALLHVISRKLSISL